MDGRLQTSEAAAATAAALRRFGIIPGQTPPDQAARRINDSLIRDRLLAVLDRWLGRSGLPAVRQILHAADPDPFRDELRAALQKKDVNRVKEQAKRPEILGQPARFIVPLGVQNTIPAARRAAAARRLQRQHRGTSRS